MDIARGLVQETSRQWSPRGSELPPTLKPFYSALHTVHAWWRRYRHIEVSANPDKFLQLAAGKFLNTVAGDSEIVRFAAQLVMISTRILECIEEQARLKHTCNQAWRSFDASTLLAPRVKWLKRPRNRWISPYLDLKIRMIAKKIYAYIMRVLKAIARVFASLFRLSMKTMDTVDSFSISPTTRNQGVNELFLNSTKWLDTLSENKEKIVQGIQYHRPLIEDLLDRLHSPVKYEFLQEKLTALVNAADKGSQVMKQASTTVGEVCKDLLKEGAFGFFSGIGLAKFTPEHLVPHTLPPWKRVYIDVKAHGNRAKAPDSEPLIEIDFFPGSFLEEESARSEMLDASVAEPTDAFEKASRQHQQLVHSEKAIWNAALLGV